MYIQVQPLDESLRIVWPSSGLKLASPAIGDGTASVNEDMQTIQWKNIDEMYPVCSREISIICQTSIVNIILIQGTAPLKQISWKLQNMWDQPDVDYVDNFSFVPRESLVRINIFPFFKVTKSHPVSEGFLLHCFVPSILKGMGPSEFLFEQSF